MRTQGVAVVLLAILHCAAAGAEGLESTSPGLIGERPNAGGGPTEVSVDVYLFDIDEINDVTQRFNVDMFVDVEWLDERLALPANQQSGGNRTLPLDNIWTPRGLIINDRGLSTQLPRVAEVDDLGNVKYVQRLSGEMAADLEYADFPFDIQRLPIDIVSYRYSPDELSFSAKGRIRGDVDAFSEEGWRFTILEPEIGTLSIPGEHIVRPRVTFLVEGERNTRYYVWTMFLPMTLIVFMSWTAFWLQPNLVPPRVGISTATVFSLIAFGFSIRVSLPPVPYLTRADTLVVGCTLLVFLSLAVTVIGSRWASDDRMGAALRLNAIARWAYAALFFLVIAVALLR
ncbi:MAG: hypothetical protein HKN81_01465 [Gammaproteobacteria bacterium]|nr:hypothetical protein [Gammaproteobacteria bacterium]